MANPELAGMGTTLTTLLFHGGYVHLGHVGDSRAYLYRDGRARQLSEDHSWIQEQVRAGLISPEEAKESALPQHHHALGRLRTQRRAGPAGAVRPGG
jgi:protein phosphatase